MIKYKTTWGTEIETVEIERETESSVWVNGRRSAKKGHYNYFNTWIEAKEHFVAKTRRELEFCKMRLEQARSAFETAKSLKP